MSIKMMSLHAGARIAVAVVAMSAPIVWAECSYSSGMRIGQYSVDFGKVVVDNSRPKGAVLATRLVNLGGSSSRWVAQCSGGPSKMSIAFRGVKGLLVINDANVRAYSTNVPGLGYQIQVQGSSGRPPFPTNYNFPSLSGDRWISRQQSWDAIRIDLIKIDSRVGNGPLEGGLYGQVYADPNPDDYYIRLSVTGGTILSPSCTVAEKSRNFTVRMGSVPGSEFNGIGSTSRETPFNVEVACAAAPGNLQSTVSMTMDTTRRTTLPGVLDINPAGPAEVAGGVGIQVLDGLRKPVEFGKAATVGTSKNGTYVVPFVARYMQTGAQLKPGVANGTATFTLTHQ